MDICSIFNILFYLSLPKSNMYLLKENGSIIILTFQLPLTAISANLPGKQWKTIFSSYKANKYLSHYDIVLILWDHYIPCKYYLIILFAMFVDSIIMIYWIICRWIKPTLSSSIWSNIWSNIWSLIDQKFVHFL